MHRFLPLLALLVAGCMETSAVVQRFPFQPPSPPVSPQEVSDFAVALEASASTIQTIFKYGGSQNEIRIRDSYSAAFGDTSIVLPAGCNFSYALSELGGSIVFGSPKPIVTTKVLGVSIHPILDRIVLREPNQAVAHVRDMFGVEHTQLIELPQLSGVPEVDEVRRGGGLPLRSGTTGGGGPDSPSMCTSDSVVPARMLPEPRPLCSKLVPTPASEPMRSQRLPKRKLFFWSANYGHNSPQDWCIPCNRAIKDFDEHYDDLPFELVVDPQDLRPFTTTRPCFQWANCSGKVFKQSGYSGYDALIKAWKDSCLPEVKAAVAAGHRRDLSAMAAYTGPHRGVNNMTVRYHLINHHDFTPEELKGWSEDQLYRIHSACHKDD